jgi:FkbM family methyltransferase
VFSQIFVTDEYGPLHSLQDVRFIIDCGAYIGFSSAYLLSRFPEATLIAIEPDKQNYELLKQNLRPYGDRAKTLNAAVWPSNAGVKVSASGVGAEAEWATTVRQCRDGEQPDVKSIDVETLLAQTGYKQIDIAKMDIEGAEELLFAHSVNGWVNKVRAFAIELHNEECRKVFYRALNSDVFTFSLSGEVTIAHRR